MYFEHRMLEHVYAVCSELSCGQPLTRLWLEIHWLREMTAGDQAIASPVGQQLYLVRISLDCSNLSN